VLTSSFSTISANEIKEVEVKFNGQSDKAYYFTTTDTEKVMEITFVSKKAVSKYDLNKKEYIGKTFIITYEIDTIEVDDKSSKSDVEVKQFKKRLILIDIKERKI
ncbi:hypothetical protein, partial [Aquimarina sp. AD10]